MFADIDGNKEKKCICLQQNGWYPTQGQQSGINNYYILLIKNAQQPHSIENMCLKLHKSPHGIWLTLKVLVATVDARGRVWGM